MHGGLRRLLLACGLFGAAAICLVGGSVAALAALAGQGFGWPQALAVVGLVLGVAAYWQMLSRLAEHFVRLDRLRGDLLVAAETGDAIPVDRTGDASEVARIAQAVGTLIGSQRSRQAARDRQIENVLGALAEGVVLMTAAGQVSLINGAAKAALGTEARLGTSLYDVFPRDDLTAALNAARERGGAIAAQLRDLDGTPMAVRVTAIGTEGDAMLQFPAPAGGFGRHVDRDPQLHRPLPPHRPATPETPLDELPAVSLDTETTGLDATKDRIVSFGAVTIRALRLLRERRLDLLVNPSTAIPAAATAVHGISDGMVAGEPDFASQWPTIGAFLADHAIVGHHVGFDLALLRNECARAGAEWRPPFALDTMLLYAALRPLEKELDLDAVAERLGVPIEGRHTALGDALVAANLFLRLIPLLKDAGVATLGQALEFSRRPKRLVARQRAAGWDEA